MLRGRIPFSCSRVQYSTSSHVCCLKHLLSRRSSSSSSRAPHPATSYGPLSPGALIPYPLTARAASLSLVKALDGRAALSTNLNNAANKLVLVDGHHLAFRAYWGLVRGPISGFSTSDGIPTSVCFGFIRSLMAVLEQERPDALIVAFDAPVASFRSELLSTYKLKRAKAPPEFGPDLRNLQLLLSFMRIYTVSTPSFEADDVIAGTAQQASQSGYQVRILTGDRDLWQVVNDACQIAVLSPSNTSGAKTKGKGGNMTADLIDEAAVRDRLGVAPPQVPDLKALMGDSSDDIPGVPGIGPKTAVELLSRCGTLEGVYQHLDSHKPSVTAKLRGKQDETALYKHLATVRPEAALAVDIHSARLSGFNAGEVEPLIRRLEIMSLVKQLPQLQALMGGPAPPSAELTADLPAALERLAAAASCAQEQALTAEGPSAAVLQGQLQQPAAVGTGSSSSGCNLLDAHILPAIPRAGSTGASATATAGGNPAAGTTGAGSTPGVAEAVGARQLTGGLGALPDMLQSAIPQVQLVASAEQLQHLVADLQQHKGLLTWSWPQPTPYSPGTRPALPHVICCTWTQQAKPASASTPAPAHAQSSSHAKSQASSNGAAGGQSGSECPGTPNARRRNRPRRSTSSRPVAACQQQKQQHWKASQVQQLTDTIVQQPLNTPGIAVILASRQHLPAEAVLVALKPVLEDPYIPKVMFESKRCYTELRHWGINLAGIAYDVLTAGCLLDPERWKERATSDTSDRQAGVLDPEQQQQHALPVIVQDVLNTSLPDMAKALSSCWAAGQSTNTADFAAADAPWFAAAEAWGISALHSSFSQQMLHVADQGQLQRLYQQVELPLQQVLSGMEFTGIGCDRSVLEQQKEKLEAEVALLEAQLYELAGEAFSLRSRQQLSRIIFDKLGLRGKGIATTKSGYKSTSMEELAKLEDHPFKATYLQYVRLDGLLSRYYNSTYMDAINPATGRMHTILHQVGGATGRINSSHPNLQNIPTHDPRGVQMRAAFKPADGYVLMSADYSQVELRVVAALSGDKALRDAFAAGQDVHEATARSVLGKSDQDPISPAERQMGKRLNFSVVYGAGSRKLAQDMGLPQKQAKAFLDRFNNAHPELFAYMTSNQQTAVASGYTVSVLGRRRCYKFHSEQLRRLRGAQDLQQLPDMDELKRLGGKEDANILRGAANAPIQGTSSDVMKSALIQLYSRLVGPPRNCRLLLTVHDEVLLEVPRQQLLEVQKLVVSVMEGIIPGLQLKVGIRAGDNWLECS